jgi:hypothetical protein
LEDFWEVFLTKQAQVRPLYTAAAALIVCAVAVLLLWLVFGGGDDKPVASPTASTPAPTLTPDQELTSEPEPEPSPTKTTASSQDACEGPDTQFNLEGERKDSLLPDCGTTPVNRAEQRESGLSLACGGSYPVILYKTTTTGAKTSICGKDASGVDFRFVTQVGDGPVLDLKGDYAWELDEFVATDGDTSYAVQAYDGTLRVAKGGKVSTQKSKEWISLDNEPDYD